RRPSRTTGPTSPTTATSPLPTGPRLSPSTSSRPGFRARTCPSPGSAPGCERATAQGCGSTSPAPSRPFDPDWWLSRMSPESSPQQPMATWSPARGVWETPVVNLLCGHSEPFSQTWPASGSMRSGRAWERPTSAPRTGAAACSSSPGLPTPRAVDGKHGLPRGGAAADPVHVGYERPRPTRLGRPGSAAGRVAAPVAAGLGHGHAGQAGLGGVPAAPVAGGAAAAAATESVGRVEGRPEPARLVGGPDAPKRGRPTPADSCGVEPERRGGPRELGGPATTEPRQEDERERAGDTAVDRGPQAPDWGPYAPAIARWERVMMRPAPAPTEPGRTGERLSPAFV